MRFRSLSEFIYVRSIKTKNGNGFYVELVDSDYNKYRFYSKKEFKFDKGQKVLPFLEIYTYLGRLHIRLVGLEAI